MKTMSGARKPKENNATENYTEEFSIWKIAFRNLTVLYS